MPRPERASRLKKKESETWTNRNATCQEHIFINSVWTILDQNELRELRMVQQWEGLDWPSAQISTPTACLRRRGRRYHMIQAKKIWKQLQTKALCHSSSGVNLRKWLLPHSLKVLSVSTLLTAFSRFTVYNPQSTYINLHVKDLKCLQTDFVQHLRNFKVLPSHTKSRNNKHGTAYSEVIQSFGASTSSQYLMGASPSGFQIACFLASQPTPM